METWQLFNLLPPSVPALPELDVHIKVGSTRYTVELVFTQPDAGRREMRCTMGCTLPAETARQLGQLLINYAHKANVEGDQA